MRLADLQGQSPQALDKALAELREDEAEALLYAWEEWARDDQIPPDWDWNVWLLLAGRGAGKTRSGAEWVRQQVERGARRIALVAPTAADVRDTMVEGESGLLAIHPPRERPTYEPSKRRVTWSNGAIATLFSADEPDRLRGPQHEAAWCDELAAWRYLEDAWANLMMGLRLGQSRAVVTTTPRPIRLLRDLLQRDSVAVTRANTRANLGNLSRTFRDQIIAQYEGTRLGRQELDAEILDDVPGALWTRDLIEATRVQQAPDLRRVVVGVDPAATGSDTADQTGIVVVGLGRDGHGYVLGDYTLRATPDGWAQEAARAYHEHEADRIIAERNQGGDMVTHTLRTVDSRLPVSTVHASKGKVTRAEPVAALYEQGKVHHVGRHDSLEDEQCIYDGSGDSPDRMDALVWAVTELMLGEDRRVQSKPIRGLV